MIHRYIIEVTDEVKGFEKAIEKLDREWGIEELEPCDDAISRAEVHDLLATWLSDYLTDETREALETINGKIGDMPPVTPQQNMGRWIDEGQYADGHSEHAYRCSECDEHYIGYVGEFKYCPNCGAKMEVEE